MRLALLVLVAGCGRLGFDERGETLASCGGETLHALYAGHRSTCFLGDGGSRWCIGENSGLGMPAGQTLPQRIPGEDGWTDLVLGYDANNFGYRDGALYSWQDAPPTLFQSGVDYADISVEDFEVCFRTAAGIATCGGTVLAGTWSHVSAGQEAFCGVKSDGTLWCWGTSDSNDLGVVIADGQVIDSPQQVGTDTDWVDVTMGYGQACGRKHDNTLWCWGSASLTGMNGADTMGVPTRIAPDTDWTWLLAKFQHTCAGKPGGRVLCWGADGYSSNVLPGVAQVDVPTDYGYTFDDFVMGGHHYCASIAGAWTCWGWNAAGQLGTGDTMDRAAPGAPFCGG